VLFSSLFMSSFLTEGETQKIETSLPRLPDSYYGHQGQLLAPHN